MKETYRSKRDAWIVILVWAGMLLGATGAVMQLKGSGPLLQKVAILALSVLVVAFVLSLIYGISYTIQDNELVIRAGPFKQCIPLASIDSVRPSRNPLSSPAASLDRLLIKWNDERRRVLISPADKMDFMNTLDSRCAHLARVGDELVRISSSH